LVFLFCIFIVLRYTLFSVRVRVCELVTLAWWDTSWLGVKPQVHGIAVAQFSNYWVLWSHEEMKVELIVLYN
jgi:hypothetical protein